MKQQLHQVLQPREDDGHAANHVCDDGHDEEQEGNQDFWASGDEYEDGSRCAGLVRARVSRAVEVGVQSSFFVPAIIVKKLKDYVAVEHRDVHEG